MTTPLPDQCTSIEKKLSSAWMFLTGKQRCFRFFEGMVLEDTGGVDRRIVLPMALHDANHLAATVLLIGREDAEQLAASMFGMVPEALAEADIEDACTEACNVLSGAIVDYLSANDEIEIGLPKVMEATRYQTVLNASGIKAYYKGGADSQHLTLVVFDPLKGPVCQEHT